MNNPRDETRRILREHGLRVTAPRLAVLEVLFSADTPLSHGDVLQRIGDADCDPATIYRNLVKLRDAGVAPVVSRAGGIDRYALARPDGDNHRHAHFVCEDCGEVACLPAELTSAMSVDGPWRMSVERAMVQLLGECPDCRAGRGA